MALGEAAGRDGEPELPPGGVRDGLCAAEDGGAHVVSRPGGLTVGATALGSLG